MNRRQENCIILAIFIGLLLALTVVNILPDRQPRRIRAVAPLTAEGLLAQAPGDNASAGPPEDNETDMQQHIAGLWGSDPFDAGRIKGMAPPPQGKKDEAGREEPLAVSLILISDAGRTAVINGRTFTEGDMVEGAEVLSIRENSVVIEKAGKARELFLQKSAVHIQQHSGGQ